MITLRRRREADGSVSGAIRIEDRRPFTDGEPPTLQQLDVDRRGDPERCEEVVASLMEEYERYVENEHTICRGCPVVRSGPFVARSMLEWKASHDGRLGHWTREDIRAYLLERFPREVSSEPHLLYDAPTCAKDVVYFMSDRGTLAGEEMDELTDATDEVLEGLSAMAQDQRSRELARETSRVGAAKIERFVHRAGISSDGVEPSGVSGRRGGRSPRARRGKRRAVREARKRNRR